MTAGKYQNLWTPRWEGEREREDTEASGTKQGVGGGAQAEGWGSRIQTTCLSSAFGLKKYLVVSPFFWGIRAGPSQSHFLSLSQHLSPHSYSWIIPGVVQKKNKKQLLLELMHKGYNSAKGHGDGCRTETANVN